MACKFKFSTLAAVLFIAGCSGSKSSKKSPLNPENPADTPTVWTRCAEENEVCLFNGAAEVRYGFDNVFVTQTANYAKACSNGSFGVDPVPGIVKFCEYGNLRAVTPDEEGWIFCANENGHCAFTGQAEVRYGENNIYFEGVYTDGVDCNNQVFGDPLVGVVKKCEYRPL